MSRRTVAGAVAVIPVLLLAACGGSGTASIDDDAFAACVADAGGSLDGSGDWTAEEQQQFWAEPGSLACAVSTLDDDQRADALEPAFPDWSDFSPRDDSREAESQQAIIGTFTAAQADEAGTTRALGAATTIIDSLWVADADSDSYARGMVSASVLSAMRTEGLLEGYDAYLASHPDATDDVNELTAWYINSGGDDPADERPTDADRERFDELADPMLAEIRD